MSKLGIAGGAPVADWSAFDPISRKNTGYSARLGTVVESGVWDGLSDDRYILAFEEAWAAFNAASYCVSVTNGTHALQLALEAADIGAGDEVIVPAITWYTTASAVCDVNAVPVMVDLDAETACISFDAIERALTPRTRAIIVVHLYQQLADIGRIREFATRHDLVLIEDCAHAHGARWQQVGPGVVGDFGCYSFQMGKLISSGEGGAILTSSLASRRRLLSLRNCGRVVDGAQLHGGNYRMTSLQAELLLQQVEGFARVAERLNAAVHMLETAVRASPGVRPLRVVPGVTRRTGLRFAFLLEPEVFGGVPAAVFRSALSAELGLRFSAGDVPLHRAANYQPHLKRRHQWDPRYAQQLDPRRWQLPIADALFDHQLVVADWRILGCPAGRSYELGSAVSKLYEHRDELRRAAGAAIP